MIKIFKLFIVILFLSHFFLSFIQAQTVQKKTILDFKDELKLTKEQEEKIRKIVNGFEGKVKGFNEKMVKVDGEIRRLLEEKGDIKEVEKKVREFFQLRAEAVIEEIKAGREIDKLLTSEQREKWRKIRRGER
mgnify:CR=1 FL=1